MDGLAAGRLGSLGEEMALLYFEALGFHVVARRHRTRYGEIDLVVRRRELLVFVEVKARRGSGCGEPQEAVTASKLARLRRLAAAFLATGAAAGCQAYRFDVLGLLFLGEGRGCRIEHYAGAAPALR